MGKNLNSNNRIVSIGNNTYRLQRVVDATATNLHHIMGKCNRLKYNTNIHQNIVRVNEREHIAFNNYFKDKQNPREQLLKVFNLVKPVLSEGVKQELEVILNASDDLFYIPELIKCSKTKKKTKSEQNSKKLQEHLFK